VAREVEGTDEFAVWFGNLKDDEHISVGRGDKTGNDRWYEEHGPIADTLYEEFLRELEREGLT
jgi:hypothetical protein